MDLVCFDPHKIYAARISYDENSESVKVRFSAAEELGINDTEFELCRNEDIDGKVLAVMSDEIEPDFELRSVFAYLVANVMMSDLSDAREKNRFFQFRMPNEYLNLAEQKALETISGPEVTETSESVEDDFETVSESDEE